MSKSGDLFVLERAAASPRLALEGVDQLVVRPGRRLREQAPENRAGVGRRLEHGPLIAMRAGAHLGAKKTAQPGLSLAHATPPAASTARRAATLASTTLWPLCGNGVAPWAANLAAASAVPGSSLLPTSAFSTCVALHRV